MAGTAINPAPVNGENAGARTALSASYVNSFRITAVADRLAVHVHSLDKNDTVEFFNLCLSLARGIDYAVANSEVPSTGRELPLLLKKVCQRKNDCLLQAAIMVLMISVKNACKNGWFSSVDNEDLIALADEIGSSFCSGKDITTEASSLQLSFSPIMTRFYPQFRMGQVLAFVNAKPGYDAYVIDFHILKNASSSPEDKIRLFVAQTDNMETSSCIISPQQVNFLLNGKGVDRRTNVFMDTGPQVPTNVTHMLKYGTNLLQAVGQFNGNYMIIVAFMSMDASPVRPMLQDYIHHPTIDALDSDSEIIEGPSRISLNCPISFKRIKTPVKGSSCKHLQCFDFDNYVDINSRRPSWRCPHCNQSVCFTDIRIDKKMVKILKEVGENVADVMISSDGSWKAVVGSSVHRDKRHDEIPNCQEVVAQKDSINKSNLPPDIMDLTEGDDEMNAVGTCENEDMKPFSANILLHSDVGNSISDIDAMITSVAMQNTPAQIEDDFWSGIYLPVHGQETLGARLDTQNNSGVSESSPTNRMLSPVLTDAVSPAFSRETEGSHTTALATSIVQSQFSDGSSQLQQLGNSSLSNEYGRFPSMPRNISRTPVAIQALPVQTSVSVAQQRSRVASQISPTPLAIDGSSTVLGNVERQHQSRSHLHSLQGSYMSSSLQRQIGNWGPHGHMFNPSRPAQPALPAANQLPIGYRVSPVLGSESQSFHQHQSTSQRMSHVRSQSPSLTRSHLSPIQTHQGSVQNRVTPTSAVGKQQDHFAAAQRVSHVGRMHGSAVPVQTPRTSSSFPANVDGYRPSVGNAGELIHPVTRADGSVDLSAENQDWRPSGRMRGSLSGQAYSAALNQYIIQPTQPTQPAGPLANMATSSGAPSPLHVLMAKTRNNSLVDAPASTARVSGALQKQTTGMN